MANNKFTVRNNIGSFVTRQERKMLGTMHKILILGGSHAALLTPIGDTSNLINSVYREVENTGSSVVGRLGYTANYAKYVHDPNIKQKFIRATAKKEFLRLGFEEAKPLIDAIVEKDLAV
jgi:hypothetical protein